MTKWLLLSILIIFPLVGFAQNGADLGGSPDPLAPLDHAEDAPAAPVHKPTETLKKTAKSKSSEGKVAVDGAAVYAQPDFDSEVIDYLNYGAKVTVAKKTFTGQGGLGLFYKVRTPSGKIGFMTDTDTSLPKAAPAQIPEKAISKKKKKRLDEEAEEERDGIYLTRYVGGAFALVDYSEKFSGRTLHQSTPFFGIRLSGPDVLIPPPLDINFLIAPGPPQYLAKFGHGASNGFLVLGDFMILLPLAELQKSLVYYGIGLMWTYSNYAVAVGNQTYNSTDLRIGADVDLGYAYKYKKYALRADLKYYIEKTMYLSEIISFQTEY
jgi:hypothetical protein